MDFRDPAASAMHSAKQCYHYSPASPPSCLIADGPSVDLQAASTEHPSGMHLRNPFVNLQAAIRLMNVCSGFSAIQHKSEKSSSIAHHLALDWQSPTPQLEVLHGGWMASITKWTLCSEGERTATSTLRSLEGTSAMAVCTRRDNLHPSPRPTACRHMHATGHRRLGGRSANPIPNSRA